MTLALSLFVLFYILMLAVQQYRPWVALGGAGAFLLLGKLGVYDFTLADAARAVDFNVLLMMAGMMGTVFLFIQSKRNLPSKVELISASIWIFQFPTKPINRRSGSISDIV